MYVRALSLSLSAMSEYSKSLTKLVSQYQTSQSLELREINACYLSPPVYGILL